MAMEPKTLETILDETEAYHGRLMAHLKHCRDKASGERERMLLDYIVDHEQWISSALYGLERKQYAGAMNTWFYEYTDRHAILFSDPEQIPFHEMPYEAINEEILEINDQIIDLFEHLKQRSESKGSEEALGELLYHLKANAKNLSQGAADTEGL